MAELRQYRYFVEIARRGTFTAAAEALNMTQSALSEQILQMERECGSPLFHRGHAGITLTPAGEYLLPRAESLLAAAAEAREGLTGFRHGYQCRLRVASILGALQSWLPAALERFAQAEPHVQLQVVQRQGVNEMLADVAADLLDLAVVSLRPAAPARSRRHELEQVTLLEEDLVALVPQGHSLGHLAEVRQADLRDTHLVTFPDGYNLRRTIDEWFQDAGVAPMVAAEAGAIEVMLSLVTAGVGVALVPRSLAQRRALPAGMQGLSLGPVPPRRVVAAVTRRDGRHPLLTSSLIEIMRTECRSP